MELIFQTKHYKTRVAKYATIYSNDPAQSTVKIHLSSTIDPTPDTSLPFILNPDQIEFSKDDKKAEIELENKGNSKIWIKDVGDMLEGLSVDIKNDDPKPGQKSELRFKYDGDFQKEEPILLPPRWPPNVPERPEARRQNPRSRRPYDVQGPRKGLRR